MTRITESDNVFLKIAAYVSASAILGLAVSFHPLYSINQNPYYLHGLARAGFGLLRDDWYANTVDPLPAFSKIVELLYAYGHPYLFYLFQFLFCGIYAVSLVGIAVEVFRIRKGIFEYGMVFAVLVILDSFALGYFSSAALGFDPRQYVPDTMPGEYFQPSTFGSLLFLSILLFLRRQRAAAVVCMVVAANVHPVYLLGAGSLTLAFLALAYREDRTVRTPLFLGCAALVLVLPIVIYTAVRFSPTTAQTWRIAAGYLVERSPHLSPEAWMWSAAFGLRAAVILVALYACRRTALFPIILVPLVVGVTLVAAQLWSGNSTLEGLYSYRMFVLLGPVATACVVGWAVASALRSEFLKNPVSRKVIATLAAGGVLLAAAFGANATRWWFQGKAESKEAAMYAFVAAHKQRGDVYVTSPEWTLLEFRLATGAPQFVDWKGHPRKDLDVIEWHTRVALARRFYRNPQQIECSLIPGFASEYHITHLVVPAGAGASECRGLDKLHEDGNYAVYRIAR